MLGGKEQNILAIPFPKLSKKIEMVELKIDSETKIRLFNIKDIFNSVRLNINYTTNSIYSDDSIINNIITQIISNEKLLNNVELKYFRVLNYKTKNMLNITETSEFYEIENIKYNTHSFAYEFTDDSNKNNQIKNMVNMYAKVLDIIASIIY